MNKFKALLAVLGFSAMIWQAKPTRWDDAVGVAAFLLLLLPPVFLGLLLLFAGQSSEKVDMSDPDIKGKDSLLVLSATNWIAKIIISLIPFGGAWCLSLDPQLSESAHWLLGLGFLALGVHYREVIDVRQRTYWKEFGFIVPFFRSSQTIVEPRPLRWEKYRSKRLLTHKLKAPGLWAPLVDSSWHEPQEREAIAREFEEKYPDLFYYEPDETLP